MSLLKKTLKRLHSLDEVNMAGGAGHFGSLGHSLGHRQADLLREYYIWLLYFPLQGRQFWFCSVMKVLMSTCEKMLPSLNWSFIRKLSRCHLNCCDITRRSFPQHLQMVLWPLKGTCTVVFHSHFCMTFMNPGKWIFCSWWHYRVIPYSETQINSRCMQN